jgi:adenylyltransferase/sulfurtransferase
MSLLQPYDIILDCTDNAPTRYLISDTAVALKRPLVSGAALKYEGQLCVYNLGEDGPCYRCLYPKPPAPEAMESCEESGILGAVTGVIGNLQALETIKLVTGLHGIYSKYQNSFCLNIFFASTEYKPSLLLFSALGTPPFRSIKLRSRKPTCPACGTAEKRLGTISDIDYVQFCGGITPDWEKRGLIQGDVGHRICTKVR